MSLLPVDDEAARFEVPRDLPRGLSTPEHGPHGSVDAYLQGLDHGLVLVDRDGRVAVFTAEAGRLLGLSDGFGAVGRPIVSVLRAIGPGDPEGRAAVLALLREPPRQTRSTILSVAAHGRDLSVDVRSLAGAGWAVAITDVRRDAGVAQEVDGWRDALTGLANRTMFTSRLKEGLARLQRTREGFALLAIDLDRFKHVNDSLGHPVGDELLRKVAERLQTTLRPTDTAARLGGDEFAVVQSGVNDAAGAERLAKRIVDLLGRSYMVEGHLINIGASVGVALAPADGNDPHDLIKNADLALYRAKADGRDTFRFFTPEMSAQVEARRRLELDLRKALAMREFELFYQPQLNLETDRIIGCEALIRWRHPTRGTVSPAEFIPLAEEIGLIVGIGEWVIRTACKEAARWPDALTVAVNLSPAQFQSKKLVATVASALAASGLAPRRLELEITEGVLLQESEANLATLHALRALGLRISMDDFGTGYSSLSYLRSFPFDKIKIDRSFVSGESAKGDAMAIIRAIASLGASFGMTTVAEGVETHEQMQRIRTEGCTDVQGYHISRPVPAAAIMQLFLDQSGPAPIRRAV